MFRLDTSSNISWDYDDFNDIDPYWPFLAPRSAAWTYNQYQQCYTGLQDTMADPQTTLGVNCLDFTIGWWWIENPCGIVSANFQNGYRKCDNAALWMFDVDAKIYSDLNSEEYAIPAPAGSGWEAWSRNETLDTGAVRVALFMQVTWFLEAWVEAGDVTLALNSSNTPVIVIGGEQGNYSLDCVLTNQTTGDSVELNFTMSLNEILELDTDEKTVIYLDDNSNQFQALTVSGGPRRDWLPLAPGSNTLKFDDVGTNAVTIDITHQERYYQ
jgi:hypothetical protein